MSIPLLTTKLYIPPFRSAGVSRPRILQKLNDALHQAHRLILVSAPAGFGKTTLLSEWHSERMRDEGRRMKKNLHPSREAFILHPFKAVWLSLDENDNDPTRFLTYLIAALQSVESDLGQPILEMLAGPPLPPLDTLMTVLVNDLTALPLPTVLVLDDYHVISTEAIHRAVQFLVDHQPPTFHLVILTRADPPLSLSRWRARGQITEIRADELRFTLAEAGEFLTGTMGLAMGAEAVSALEQRTEGWVAGLQLAALSVQGWEPAQVAAFVETFSGSHRYVIDYLVEEVWQRQGDEVRDFLGQTAVLDRVCAGLADAVTGRSDGQTMLQQLEQANLFIVPLDNERRWYRYHPLLADSLRVGQNPAQQAAGRRQAARWFIASGLVEEAVHYALAVPDPDLAADIIEQTAREGTTLSSGRLTPVLGWLKQLPESALRQRPWLGFLASRALALAGQLQPAERLLDEVEKGLAALPEPPELEGIIASYRCSLAASRGQVQRVLELAGQALEALSAGDLLSRARVYGALGIAYEWAGRLAEASHAFEQAELLAQQIGVRYLAISVSCDQAWIQVKQGQLGRARQRGEQALQLAQIGGIRIPPAAHPCALLAEIALEQNDLVAAEVYARDSVELGRQGELANSLRVGYIILARVKLAQGDSEGALAAIDQADQIVRSAGVVHMIEEMSAYRARVWLAQGRLDEARRWAQTYERSRTEPVEYLREFSELTLAQLRLAENRPVEALSLLDPLLPEAQAQNRLRPLMEMQLGRALAWQALSQPDKALAALEHALALAEPEGYVRVFLDQGPRLSELLENMQARETTGRRAEFIQKLLLALPGDKGEVKRKPLRPSPKAFTPDPAIDPLSEQELAVLRLLAAGLSNQEIADRLFISLGTAKWHVHNLHGKLGVKSRTQAAARARELGLI